MLELAQAVVQAEPPAFSRRALRVHISQLHVLAHLVEMELAVVLGVAVLLERADWGQSCRYLAQGPGFLPGLTLSTLGVVVCLVLLDTPLGQDPSVLMLGGLYQQDLVGFADHHAPGNEPGTRAGIVHLVLPAHSGRPLGLEHLWLLLLALPLADYVVS